MDRADRPFLSDAGRKHQEARQGFGVHQARRSEGREQEEGTDHDEAGKRALCFRNHRGGGMKSYARQEGGRA